MLHICMVCHKVMKDDEDGDTRETHGVHIEPCARETFGPELVAEYLRRHPGEVAA